MILNFLRPPQLDGNISTEERAVLGVKYVARIFVLLLLVTVVLLMLTQPPKWFEAVIGLIICFACVSGTIAAFRVLPKSIVGYVGMALAQLLGLWTIIFLAGDYSIATLVWLPLVSWFVVGVMGNRAGILFMLLNLTIYLIYHTLTVPMLPKVAMIDAPALIVYPNEFRVSFAIFLCISTLIIILIDTTRRRNESKLAQSEKMRTLYLEQTSMAVIHCDPSGQITGWNPAATDIFGYSEGEAIGKNAIRFLAVSSKPGRIDKLVDALQHGDATELRNVNQNRTKDGIVISCEWFNTAISSENQKLLGWIFSAVDITERIQKERELKLAKEQAEAATEAKSTFLANMSHEIRTPMNGVIGMTSLLSSSDLNNEQNEFVETIRKSGNALLEIINEILDFSKIESGKILLEEHPFAIRECVQDVLSLFMSEVQIKGITLTHTVANDVPMSIVGDSGRLRQILVNLIGNAVKFTEDGGITIDIGLESEKSIRRKGTAAEIAGIHFSIQDSGIGIPADKIDTLFDSFSQADISTTRKYGGTGLGLSITKRLVEIMNGTIWVESRTGHGSIFHFIVRLPIAPQSSHRLPPVKQAIFHKNTESNQRPHPLSLSILLVEDNQVNQKVVLHLLKRMGFSADVAGNGLEAVEAVQRQQYDLVLMDVQMPEMDGLEATQQIRGRVRDHSQPKIIAMTAAVMQEDRQRTFEAGMDGFVSKPIKASELEEVLRSVASTLPAKQATSMHIT